MNDKLKLDAKKESAYGEYLNKSDKTSLLISRILTYIFLAFVTVLSLFSFYLLVINSTRSQSELATGFSLIPAGNFLTNLQTAWNDTSIFWLPQGMLNSFIISACTAIVTTYFSAMTAYGIFVYDFKLKGFAHNFIMIIMMIPTQVSALGFIQLCNSWGLLNSYIPLILPAVAAPATYFYMKQYIDSTLPLEIVEAARVDGSNEFKTFNFICLPILKPAIAVQMIFAFVGSWNNYFTPALLLSKKELYTLPIMLAIVRSRLNSQAGDMGEVYMIILLSILPVVLVYLVLSKFIIKGVTLGSVKG